MSEELVIYKTPGTYMVRYDGDMIGEGTPKQWASLVENTAEELKSAESAHAQAASILRSINVMIVNRYGSWIEAGTGVTEVNGEYAVIRDGEYMGAANGAEWVDTYAKSKAVVKDKRRQMRLAGMITGTVEMMERYPDVYLSRGTVEHMVVGDD